MWACTRPPDLRIFRTLLEVAYARTHAASGPSLPIYALSSGNLLVETIHLPSAHGRGRADDDIIRVSFARSRRHGANKSAASQPAEEACSGVLWLVLSTEQEGEEGGVLRWRVVGVFIAPLQPPFFLVLFFWSWWCGLEGRMEGGGGLTAAVIPQKREGEF